MKNTTIILSHFVELSSKERSKLITLKFNTSIILLIVQNFALFNSKKKMKPNSCSFCKKVDPNLKYCARCKKVKYCGSECQKKDWSLKQCTQTLID